MEIEIREWVQLLFRRWKQQNLVTYELWLREGRTRGDDDLKILAWVTEWMMERKDSLRKWGGEPKSGLNLAHVMLQVSVSQ